MNLISLAATLYLCGLLNFDAVIADYNVTHSREASGKGVNIDVNYLYGLGPQALPALDRAVLLSCLYVGYLQMAQVTPSLTTKDARQRHAALAVESLIAVEATTMA